jgi:phage terminase large subunit-like protein
MKDKELREILNYSDLINIDNKGRLRMDNSYGVRPSSGLGLSYTIREKIHDQEKRIQDQQEQIDFILKHLNIDIEKFEGYVKKKLDK